MPTRIAVIGGRGWRGGAITHAAPRRGRRALVVSRTATLRALVAGVTDAAAPALGRSRPSDPNVNLCSGAPGFGRLDRPPGRRVGLDVGAPDLGRPSGGRGGWSRRARARIRLPQVPTIGDVAAAPLAGAEPS